MTRFFKPIFFSNQYFLLVFLILLFVGWNVFSAVRFVHHKNVHRDLLEELVVQAREVQHLISSGDARPLNEMFSDLSQPSVLILEELKTWDAWMNKWLSTWLFVTFIILFSIASLLASNFVPKKSIKDKGNDTEDKRRPVPVSVSYSLIILLIYNFNEFLAIHWQVDLQTILRTWQSPYFSKGSQLSGWVNMFSNIWPENFSQTFDYRFGIGMIGYVVPMQIIMTLLLCFPLFYKTNMSPVEVPEDELQPGERVLRFPEESERKTVDRWM